MSEITWKFDLSEEGDEFQEAFNGSTYHGILIDFAQYLRDQMKYEELSDQEYEIYEKIKEKFYELLENENISLYK